MLRFIRNMPIFRRLFIAFALAVAVPAVVIVFLGNFDINNVSTRGQAVRTSFDAQNAASTEQNNLERMNALLQTRHNQIFASLSKRVNDSSLAASGALISADIFTREADFNQALVNYQTNYELATSSNMKGISDILLNDDPQSTIAQNQQAELNQVINVDWPAYRSLQDHELGILNNPMSGVSTLNQAYANAYNVLFKANDTFTNLKNDWQGVVDSAVQMGKTVTNVGASQTQPIIIATVISLFAVVLVVLATGYIVNLTITQPLRQLAYLTRRISKGETQARAKITGRDEIFTVANSMNSMLDNIVRLIQETQSQRDNLQTQVEKLVSEVSGVGEGDLSIQAEVTSDALGVLADSFNYMVEELGSLIVRVKQVAQEVEGSTIAILDHMGQLVETGDIQLGQISQATVEVENMANSSRQVADRAQTLYNVAQDARSSAEGGREAVEQAVEGMGRIHTNVQSTSEKVQQLGENSREINNIVEVISSIAHQTNRLALDAAIQAAMAGENGKGFGAVAADIRRLAERAKEQAGSIARIVRSVREDIGAAAVSMQDTERETSVGAQLTEQAGTALESIFSAVEYQAREIENINQVTVQQLQTSGAIVQIMRSISNSTQQSTISTRSASQNTERLARLVEQLRASTEAFKLREENALYTPSSNVSVFEESQDNQLSISGIFRTVSASALVPSVGAGGWPQQALPPARPSQVYGSYASQQMPQNGGWNQSAPAPVPQNGGWNQQSAPVPQRGGWNQQSAPMPQSGGWNQQSAPMPQSGGWNQQSTPVPQNGGWNQPAPRNGGWGDPRQVPQNGGWNQPAPVPVPQNGGWNQPAPVPVPQNGGWNGIDPRLQKKRQWNDAYPPDNGPTNTGDRNR
jgi:methyl-accepting chemotaxis protein